MVAAVSADRAFSRQQKIKKGQLRESPSPRRVVGQLGGSKSTPMFFDSSQKLKHQMQKIKKMKHQSYKQNRYGK